MAYPLMQLGMADGQRNLAQPVGMQPSNLAQPVGMQPMQAMAQPLAQAPQQQYMGGQPMAQPVHAGGMAQPVGGMIVAQQQGRQGIMGAIDGMLGTSQKQIKIPNSPTGLPVDLTTMTGVVIVQKTQMMEMLLQSGLGLPVEIPNEYFIAPLPHGVHAAREQRQDGLWLPSYEEITSMQFIGHAKEESDAMHRCITTCIGMSDRRHFNLDVYFYNQPTMRLDRPFACSKADCFGLCCELNMSVHGPSGEIIGHADESCNCSNCFSIWCCCHNYFDIKDAAGQVKHTLRTNRCCFGRVNNCFGATCCKANLIMDIGEGPVPTAQPVTTVQKVFTPASSFAGYSRMYGNYSNYILEFPPKATHAERLILLAGVFHEEFFKFDQKPQRNRSHDH